MGKGMKSDFIRKFGLRARMLTADEGVIFD